ncbi:MAG: pyruvate dehydrogenase (acetyl-transferring) E1 component subunit alpha [Alphaproteobacteria bacterium]|nr:pyruvate dehydrogenase (acetyl-transferring) E1 component subunit alpha [Alphaproteobacteria bacterium]
MSDSPSPADAPSGHHVEPPPADRGLPPENPLPDADKDQLLELYRQMALMRRVEELAAKAYTQRKILGFCHLYIGQESVAVGAAAATGGDHWITAYREHGHALAKGVPARAIMAELFGRETGASKGQGGSMHIFDKSVDFMGGYGIVGAHVPMANGVAWACKQKKLDKVCVVFFGDGAANQGAFFEALCLAELYKLPVVFICENNWYAMGTPLHRQSALTDMSLRARGVGMTREQLEGWDVEHVRQRVAAARKHALEHGPVLLEIITYRYRGHSMSDPAKYRPQGELDGQKERSDPLLLTAAKLQDQHGVGQDVIDGIHADIDAEAQDAWDFADQSAWPDPATLYDFVYGAQETSLAADTPLSGKES